MLAMRSMVSRVSKPMLVGRHLCSKPATTKPRTTLSMVNWNIDGLDEKYLTTRTAHIIMYFKKIKPSVIFLQEVREDKLEIFKSLMSNKYEVIENYQDIYYPEKFRDEKPKKPGMQYYTCVLLRKDTISVDKTLNHTYENTVSGCGLQTIDCHLENDIKIRFMNTQLEPEPSTMIRMVQLEKCLADMKLLHNDTTAILAGDMNIQEESELCFPSLGDEGLPSNVVDLWEFLGKHIETQYTWDMLINTNLEESGKPRKDAPRMRFDRIYLRQSQPRRLVPKTFKLIGTEKVPGTSQFPSDHWGILTTFKIDGNVEKLTDYKKSMKTP